MMTNKCLINIFLLSLKIYILNVTYYNNGFHSGASIQHLESPTPPGFFGQNGGFVSRMQYDPVVLNGVL